MMENSTKAPNDTKPEAVEGELRLPYVVFEVIVALFAVIGNSMVIFVFYRERRLRRRTNYYIVSLAIADLLVGLFGIPFAILASIGEPRGNLHACLFTISLLVVLCTISIFCLVAVSVDRYWAILHPLGYSRNFRTKTAIGIIALCWVIGTLVGLLPLMGWSKNPDEVKCFFTEVMDYNYLLFLYFGTIIVPAVVMAGFYAHIYRVVLKQVRRIVTMNPAGGTRPATGGGTMLRVLGAARKREVKATQNLSIIVLFFVICWIPLYTINCVQAFCTSCSIPIEFTDFCIILSHANSAINPLLYAYHLRDFQAALKTLICRILRVKSEEEEEVNNTRVGRHGSRGTLHQHGIRNSNIHQSRIRNSIQYTDSTMMSNRLTPAGSTVVNTIMSSMNDIGTLPLREDQHSKMWTLTEVPSGCEDDNVTCVELRGKNHGRSKSQGESSSGQVNSAYIEENIALDDMPGLTATLSVVNLENQTNDISKSLTEESNLQLERCVQHLRSKSVRDINNENITNECQCKHVSTNCLIVEIENSNRAVDDNEKTELAVNDKGKKPVIVTSDNRNLELVNNNGEEITKSNTSHYNQRLSPLKIVGEFLFPSNNKKLNLTKEESSSELSKSESTLLEGSDAALEGKDDRNGCALSRTDETLPK